MMSYKLLVFLMQILQIHPMSLFVSYTSLGKGQCLLFLKKESFSLATSLFTLVPQYRILDCIKMTMDVNFL